jgi:hypothetical protein
MYRCLPSWMISGSYCQEMPSTSMTFSQRASRRERSQMPL